LTFVPFDDIESDVGLSKLKARW